MKQAIEWHKECLKNMQESYRDLFTKIADLQNRSQHLSDDIHFLQSQIKKAENQNKLSFDSTHYMVNRKPKTEE